VCVLNLLAAKSSLNKWLPEWQAYFHWLGETALGGLDESLADPAAWVEPCLFRGPQTYRILKFVEGFYRLDSIFLTEGSVTDPRNEIDVTLLIILGGGVAFINANDGA